jgi:hypothetical protein
VAMVADSQEFRMTAQQRNKLRCSSRSSFVLTTP